MDKAIELLDGALATSLAKDGAVKPTDREAARDRARAMVAALRTDRSLVAALLKDARAELNRPKRRGLGTWEFLAGLAAQTGQLEMADGFFRQCLNNLPAEKEFSVYQGLIFVLRRQHKYEEIITLCQTELGRRPDHIGLEMLFQPALADALAALGRYDEALKHADRAVQITSDDLKVREHCNRAQILAQAERYDEAVRECEDTLKRFTRLSDVQTVRLTLSNAYSFKGDHAKSEEQLRLILEMDPDVPLANNNLGYQMAERNVNLDEAERLIRRALELDRSLRKQVDDEGENAAYLDSLGWVLFRKGKPAEAREWLEKAVALPDVADDPAVWDHLGDVYSKLDQPAKAKEAWQKAVKLYDTAGRRKTDPKKTEIEKKLKTLE